MSLSVIGLVDDNGKFNPNSKLQFQKIFEALKGQRVELTVKKWHKTRSNNQNSYYWGVIVEMITFAINDLGNEFEKDTIHELLRSMFLQTTNEIVNKESGEVKQVTYIKSTTKLTTVEMEVYLEKCRVYAAETFDCYIPNPNE